MPDVVVLGLFTDATSAASAARALRALGVPRQGVSIVARSHDEEGVLAEASGASPGAEMEDSARASRLGELGAHLIAAIAVVMPGIGPIVADGPLAAGLGEAAGHLAGGIARSLERAGVSREEAEEWEAHIRAGGVIVGAHVTPADVERVRGALQTGRAARIAVGNLPE